MSKQQLLINSKQVKIAANGQLSLTDLAATTDAIHPNLILQSWLRTKNTLHFLTAWETMHNPNYQDSELTTLLNEESSIKIYLQKTKGLAFSIIDHDIYVPKEVAIHFCSWLNPALSVQVNEGLRQIG